MSTFVANKMIKMLIKADKQIMDSKILILGVTFKENCPDIRNSKVADVHHELKEFGLNVDAYDYEADTKEVKDKYGINTQSAFGDYNKYNIERVEFLENST